MSSYFSLKNKLGLISFIILALNFAMSHGQAKSTEETLPHSKYDYSSPVILIQKIVVMIPESYPQDKQKKSFTEPKKVEKEFKISLGTSRKEVKEEYVRKLTASSSPYCADRVPE